MTTPIMLGIASIMRRAIIVSIGVTPWLDQAFVSAR